MGSDELEGNLATLGGRPRSVEGLPAELRGARRRRNVIGDDDEHMEVRVYYDILYRDVGQVACER